MIEINVYIEYTMLPYVGNRNLEPYKDKYGTPPDLYAELDKEFHFDHDPCPLDWEIGDVDGLTSEWGQSNFVNPPYSQTKAWTWKSIEEWKKGKLVVLLINANTDTRLFHDYIWKKHEVRFIRGRLRFINPINSEQRERNPKPSMLVIFRP